MIKNLNFGFICLIFRRFRHLFSSSSRQGGIFALVFNFRSKNLLEIAPNLMTTKPEVQVKKICILVLVLFLHGCSCGKRSDHPRPRIGLDPSWSPLDFGNQTAYVNGFTEELLREIAHREGIEFEKVPANGDTLLSGLKEKKYDAVLTSLPPYTFNLAKYDFTQNFLAIGSVFIVPTGSPYKKITQIKNMPIGVLSNDSSVHILEQYPDVRILRYASVPDLLNAVIGGDVAGALLSRIPAVNYVSDLYAGKLKIISAPLNEEGLHLIAEKGAQEELIQTFNQSLKGLKKNKKYKNLLKKWSL